MSWNARLTTDGFRPEGRPPSRPVSRTSVPQGRGGPGAGPGQPRVPRPLAPQGAGRGRGAPGPTAGPSGAARRPPPGGAPGQARVAAGRPSGAAAARGANVARPVSAPSVRSGGGGGHYGPPPSARAPRGVGGAAGPSGAGGQGGPAVARARAVPSGGAAGPVKAGPGKSAGSARSGSSGGSKRPTFKTRPRSAAALHRGGRQEQLNTSVAVRNRGGRRRTLTAMAVGPQAPPGSPPRPRQVIIPAGSVDENETTVLDVPAGSPLEQPQRVIIPPGTVHADETMVVVVPAPRMVGSPPGQHYDAMAAAAAAAAEAAAEEERQREERVQEARMAYYRYIQNRPGPEAERLRHLLLHGRMPAYEGLAGYAERAAPRVEHDLWEQDMPDVPDIDVEDVDEPEAVPEAQPYRLQMSMNIEEFPAGAAGGGLTVPTTYQGTLSTPGSSYQSPTSWTTGYSSPAWTPTSPPPWGARFEEAMNDYGGDLSDIEAPESLYGEDAGWEPPPPPPPLIAPPTEEENIIPQLSPPRYVYQRPAPHDPGDLMWDWEEPPRPVYEMPIIEPEPYSAELFRLVRL